YEASEISAEARDRATAKGLRYLGPDELAYKRDAFASVKQKVLAELQGVTVLHDYENLPSSFVRVSNEDTLNALLARPEVRAVYKSRKLQLTLDQSLPLIGHEWVAGQGLDGSGTVVAVFDTGVDYTIAPFNCTSPGVPAGCRVLATRESTNIDPYYEDDGYPDDNGHGTHVSTIVALVAGDTDLVVADVCHYFFGCDEVFVADAIDWVIGLKETINIVAMNISLGNDAYFRTQYCNFEPFKASLDAARAAGIQPVVSSGNAAYSWGFFRDGLSFPACIEGVVSVGAVYDADDIGSFEWGDFWEQYYCEDATTAEDQVACFSQTADYLDLLAPGARITALGVTDSGTSFAAPHVSGAWAVMREYYDDPDTTSNEDILAIMKDVGEQVDDPRAFGGRTTKRLNFIPEPNQLLMLSSGIMALWGLSLLRLRDRGLGRLLR
ncbi:MAG: S8/S53 family peptidase, partial [Deltaproteobacteria bacterium]|nr:S8/S53 family peptidase [Deltaproteobacteria bacterium]